MTLRKWFGWTLLFVLVASGGLLLASGWRAFGHRAEGARRVRMERSPQWKHGAFENPQPLKNDLVGSLTGLLHASTHGRPDAPLAPAPVDPHRFDSGPGSGLRITWLGHASMLIELDGHRVLTDPMWSDRASPLSFLGPSRWYPPPLALKDLPALDAVLISHDHYDHLDMKTVQALSERGTTFVVPLGIGAHLAYWGVPEARIVELDWWEQARFGDLQIVATPARHASGRTLVDKDATLWAGYALLGPTHRAWFSGDTGLFPAMREIGERLGPFDVTLIESGQYHRAWPDWHIGPEQAVEAHRLVRGRVMLPVHWALLTLAYHGWTEPMERVLAAAKRSGATVLTPRPGESVEPNALVAAARWWPDVPWETAEVSPVVSTQLEP